MAEDPSKQSPTPSSEEDLSPGIPMRKASPAAWIGGALGVLLLGALAALSWGSGGAEASARAETSKAQGDAAEESQLTAKEAREHLLTTQKALAAAEQEVAAQKAAEAEAERAPSEEEGAKAPTPGDGRGEARASAPSAPAKPVSPQQSKKKIDSLDSLGADITSALK